MKPQMMRVISSPSSSTIGFTTLIFGIGLSLSRAGMEGRAESDAPEIAGNIASPHGCATPLFGRAAARRAALDQLAKAFEVGGVEIGNRPIGHAAARPVHDVITLKRFGRWRAAGRCPAFRRPDEEIDGVLAV